VGEQVRLAFAKTFGVSEVLLAMQVLTEADYIALRTLCQGLHAQKRLNKGGILFKTPNGYIQQNPLLGIIRNQMHIVNALLREFGLTPSSRTRLVAHEEDDGMHDLLAIMSQPRLRRASDGIPPLQ
jgi:P27 family predicted phage terminase small subunit